MKGIQSHVRKINPWQEDGPLKLYVDASSARFGAVLFGGEKVIAMYIRSNSRPHQHSSTSEIEGLIKSMRSVKSFLLGRAFVIYTDNWIVLRALRRQHNMMPLSRDWKSLCIGT